MKKYFALPTVLVIIQVLLHQSVNAQQTCAEKLNYAQELFVAGQIEQIPALLDSCLQNGFSKEEIIKANRLLVQVYLFDSNYGKAASIMSSFLKSFPEYNIQANDPPEFIELFNTFQVKPTWGIGLNAGVNLSQISVKEHFSTENLNKLNSKYSNDGIGFDAGLHINRYFIDNLWLTFDINYSQSNVKKKEIFGDGKEELMYTEKTSWASMPVYLNFSFGKGKLSPYLYAGGEFGYLLTALSAIQRHNLTDNTIPDIIQHSKDIQKNRELINAWAMGGVGLLYKTTSGYFNFSLGYSYSLMPYVIGKNRYTDNNALYYYQSINDDFRINRYFCSFGYTKQFYRIRKKKATNAETIK